MELNADVLIIGGGASGALTATRILQSGFAGRLAIVSKDNRLARGIAYATEDPHHLLNVMAGKMSAFPEQPDDFVRWLRISGLEAADLSNAFVSRQLYGEYLETRLLSASVTSLTELAVHFDEAVELHGAKNGCFYVKLASGSRLRASRVVLALGNLPPSVPDPFGAVVHDARWIGNPWLPGALASIGSLDSILVIGTGLSMVDVVLSLRAAGHRGKILARSRRGLCPKGHEAIVKLPAEAPKDVSGLIRACREAGTAWRGVVDSVRNDTPRIWSSMNWDERRRVLHRLGPFWDIHRHRMPETVDSFLRNQREVGLLDIGKGQASSVASGSGGLDVTLGEQTMTFSHVINCTGPTTNWRATRNSLLESAREAGLLDYDPLGLGVLVEDDGRVGNTGRLWAVGPICRGCRLETTAMPEIRVQAKLVAERLARK